MTIDLKESITPHFRWKEAMYLPTWDIYAYPPKDVYESIKLVCERLEGIRACFGAPLRITSFYRPSRYNKAIGGSRYSHHMHGMAADFIPVGKDVNQMKADIRSRGLLKSLDIRMENNGDGGWIHIDIAPVKRNRFFLP